MGSGTPGRLPLRQDVVWQSIHVAVAYLFGARKRTGYPMSLLLIVDHIAEGDKANFRIANLQFVSQLQNATKASNVKESQHSRASRSSETEDFTMISNHRTKLQFLLSQSQR